ncbi:unnamed protein product, partial [Prorocentrum cordatum]
ASWCLARCGAGARAPAPDTCGENEGITHESPDGISLFQRFVANSVDQTLEMFPVVPEPIMNFSDDTGAQDLESASVLARAYALLQSYVPPRVLEAARQLTGEGNLTVLDPASRGNWSMPAGLLTRSLAVDARTNLTRARTAAHGNVSAPLPLGAKQDSNRTGTSAFWKTWAPELDVAELENDLGQVKFPEGSDIWNMSLNWTSVTVRHPPGVISHVFGKRVPIWADVSYLSMDVLYLVSLIAYPVVSVCLLLILTIMASLVMAQNDQPLSSTAQGEQDGDYWEGPVEEAAFAVKNLTEDAKRAFGYWALFCRSIPALMVFGTPVVLTVMTYPYPQEVYTLLVLVSSVMVFSNGVYMVFYCPFTLGEMRQKMRMPPRPSLDPVKAADAEAVVHWVVFPNYKEERRSALRAEAPLLGAPCHAGPEARPAAAPLAPQGEAHAAAPPQAAAAPLATQGGAHAAAPPQAAPLAPLAAPPAPPPASPAPVHAAPPAAGHAAGASRLVLVEAPRGASHSVSPHEVEVEVPGRSVLQSPHRLSAIDDVAERADPYSGAAALQPHAVWHALFLVLGGDGRPAAAAAAGPARGLGAAPRAARGRRPRSTGAVPGRRRGHSAERCGVAPRARSRGRWPGAAARRPACSARGARRLAARGRHERPGRGRRLPHVLRGAGRAPGRRLHCGGRGVAGRCLMRASRLDVTEAAPPCARVLAPARVRHGGRAGSSLQRNGPLAPLALFVGYSVARECSQQALSWREDKISARCAVGRSGGVALGAAGGVAAAWGAAALLAGSGSVAVAAAAGCCGFAGSVAGRQLGDFLAWLLSLEPEDEQLRAAYAELGVCQGCSNKELRSAFRKAALSRHPDKAGLGKPRANERFAELTAAMELIQQSRPGNLVGYVTRPAAPDARSDPTAATRSQICVLLAMEAREEGAAEKAERLQDKYRDTFREIAMTLHPPDLPNDPAGKASNMAWAFKWLCNHVSDTGGDPANVIVTVSDADSDFHKCYFDSLANSFAETPLEKRHIIPDPVAVAHLPREELPQAADAPDRRHHVHRHGRDSRLV